MTFRTFSAVAFSLMTLPAWPAYADSQEAKVKCVYFTTDGKKKMGGTEDVTVRVVPKASTTPVTFPDNSAKGSREQWRTSAWVAAFCAARAADRLINEFEFSVYVRDQVEGPSAGMLLTGTMIALIKGQAIRPDVTITGAINPDGSIGPIGSIYYKLMGAHDSGLKVFGYPVGCRIALKEETGEPVDLQDEAEKLGMQAVEVTDMYEAYTLLTNKVLPRPVAVPENRMQISTQLSQQLRRAAELQLSDARARLAPYPKKAIDAPKEIQGRLLAAQDGAAYAKLYGDRGNTVLAGVRAERSAVDARLVESLTRLQAGRPETELRLWLEEIQRQERAADEQVRGVRKDLEAAMVQETVGGKLAAFDVCTNYWQACSWVAACRRLRELLSESPSGSRGLTHGGSMRLAGLALEYADMAQARAASLPAAAESVRESGPPAVQSDDLFRRLGDAYQITATFGMDWCTALLRRSRNFPTGLLPWEEELVLSNSAEDFQPTLFLSKMALARPLPGSSSLLPIEQLAAGNLAYLASAGMINKYYNFEAAPPSGAVMNRKAMGRALDLARQRVLEDCSLLYRRIGAVPDCLALNYELANAYRDGADDDERLLALKRYSRCVFYCELARTLLPDRAPSIRPEPKFP